MRLLASVLFALYLTGAVFAQEQADDLARLRTALKDGDHRAAAVELEALKTAGPDIFASNDLDYLLGRTYERLGDTAGAIENFESARSRNSVVKDYALWHLASLARSSGNLFLERLYLNELTAFKAESLPAEAARIRYAESYLESGDQTSAIRILERGYSSSSILPGSKPAEGTDRERTRLVLLARAYLLAGRTAEAIKIFNDVVSSTSNPEQPDDLALAAVRGLDAVDSDPHVATVLTDDERFRRASVYHFNRDFEGARRHYLAILDSSGSGPLAARCVFQIGRTFAQEGNYVDAVKWFEREKDQSSDAEVIKDSLLQAASAYSRTGKYREAVARYRTYIQNYPDDENAARAYLNIVDALRDEGEEAAAIQQARSTQEVFRGKQAEALAIFSEARIYIAASDWKNASTTLDKLVGRNDLGGANVPGGTTPPEVAFMRGYALEQRGQFGEAIEVYLSIPDGINEYYGGLATGRLKQLAVQASSKPAVDKKLEDLIAATRDNDENRQRRAATDALRIASSDETRQSLFSTLAQSYARSSVYGKTVKASLLDAGRGDILTKRLPVGHFDPNRSIAERFLYLGLFDEAAPEYEAALVSDGTAATTAGNRLPANAAYTLAVLYGKGDRGDRAAGLFRQLWNIPPDIQPEMLDPEYARFAYPAPYKYLLTKYAAARGVDPRFLLSIIRQESGFRPNVKSNAAARGLMQFITNTAEQTARDLGRSGFRGDDLYDPQVSILFGSRYTQQLFALFPDQPEAVAASYNGGEDNMKRWMARSRSRIPERYVPEIAFSQSKDYVYRVMSNYRMYQMLYDENLDPKPASFVGRHR